MLVKIMLKLDTRFIEDTSKETHILHREAPTKEEEHEKIRTQRGAWLGMIQRWGREPGELQSSVTLRESRQPLRGRRIRGQRAEKGTATGGCCEEFQEPLQEA